MMWMSRALAGFVMVLALMVPSARPANAQTTQLHADAQLFWSHTASKQNQEAAQKALEDGNRLMKQFAYAKAEAKYRESLRYWDHPGTHYNLALALIQLDRSAEVYEHLVKALEGGVPALGIEKYEHARIHKEELEKHLAQVELVCDAPDVVVTVEGRRLTLVNGRYEGRMRPGPVTFEGTADGYQSREKKFDLSPGKANNLILKLYKGEQLVEYEPRWAPWKPWAVVGTGAVLGAGGGLLYWQARQGYSSFDAHVRDCSRGAVDGGCREGALASRRNRLGTLNKASFGTMALGGAAIATGTALIFMNRAKAHPMDPDELDRKQGLAVTPLLGRSANGLLVTLQY